MTLGIRYHFDVTYQLEKLKDYGEYIESNLKQEMNKIEDSLKELDEDEADEFVEFYYDDIAHFRDEFPRLMRNSQFTTIYSFLESKMLDLCEKYEQDLKLSEITGKGIVKAQIYLKKVIKIDFPDHAKEWQYIKKSNKVRNCIVHANGDVSKLSESDQRKLINVVNDLEHISINKQRHLILDEKFCFNFINITENFLETIFKSVKK
ncbi:hypothetical protein [Jeotgalibacillus sp. JSM ZJ347]|uniref:hypothetical protein n=1 Tax=Jeotgalibacillus sp. JSM ZJ347 TaxID=3342117 RepID=UPI0035A83DB3